MRIKKVVGGTPRWGGGFHVLKQETDDRMTEREESESRICGVVAASLIHSAPTHQLLSFHFCGSMIHHSVILLCTSAPLISTSIPPPLSPPLSITAFSSSSVLHHPSSMLHYLNEEKPLEVKCALDHLCSFAVTHVNDEKVRWWWVADSQLETLGPQNTQHGYVHSSIQLCSQFHCLNWSCSQFTQIS